MRIPVWLVSVVALALVAIAARDLVITMHRDDPKDRGLVQTSALIGAAAGQHLIGRSDPEDDCHRQAVQMRDKPPPDTDIDVDTFVGACVAAALRMPTANPR